MIDTNPVLPISKSTLPEISLGKSVQQLLELNHAHIPTVPSFVITPVAFSEFISTNNLHNKLNMLLQNADAHDPHALDKVANNIQKMLHQHEYPATLHQQIHAMYQKTIFTKLATFAPSLMPHQKVYAPTSNTPIAGDVTLHQKIREFWAKQFTAQSIADWHQHQDLPIPHLLVSTLIPADLTGSVHTQNPLNQTKNHMLFSAIRGIDADDQQIADQYQVNRADFSIISQNIYVQHHWYTYSKKGEIKKKVVPQKYRQSAKLGPKTISIIGEVALKLHHQLLMPVKLDFVIKDHQLYIQRFQLMDEHHIHHAQKTLSHISQPTAKNHLISTGLPSSPGIITAPVRLLKNINQIPRIEPGEIIVTPYASAKIIPALQKASAIVTELGGPTSHAAIIAREIGCPAVTSATKITKKVKNGDTIQVNGDTGEIHSASIIQGQTVSRVTKASTPNHQESPKQTATKVLVTLSHSSSLKRITQPIDGIGMVRGDILMTEFGYHPSSIISHHKDAFRQYLTTNIQNISSAYPELPTIYCVSNLFSTHYQQLVGAYNLEPDEPNPLLGFHGGLRLISNPQILEIELDVIQKLRSNQHHQLHLTLPFVRTVAELKQLKKIIASHHLSRHGHFKVFLNLETPASILNLNQFIKLGIDGIIVNTNQLTSLTLGFDANNADVNQYYDPKDQAVLKLIRFAADAANQHQLLSYVYGQSLINNPEMYTQIVEWGMTGAIVNPSDITHARVKLAQAEAKRI